MTLPLIQLSDLDSLSTKFPTLDFSDDERKAVLLEAGSRDIQAAPGSGKTTLLAAKLHLLASRWSLAQRGICVLSHTNVAKAEISKRLGSTAGGAGLLGYPHFVGTIHAFLNHFLALPLLRSDGEIVDVIDNDISAARAFSRLRYKYSLKSWVENNPNTGPKAIASLRYTGANLEFGWEDGALPAPGTPSWNQAKEIKDALRSKGIFRFDDMFAFSERLLARFPEMRSRLSYRFPLVLIDEMQDTSWEQEELLSRIFDDTVVVQRFGDRNQRILVAGTDSHKLTFPRPGHLNVSSTKRFKGKIAAVVRSVQEHGEPIQAIDAPDECSPVLFVYSSATVGSAIEAFGKLVLSTFSDDVLQGAAVKAICARKQSDAKSAPGRHLGDYWPNFQSKSTTPSGVESIHRLLADPVGIGVVPVSMEQRVADVRRAILLALRSAKCTAVEGIRDAAYLLRRLELAGMDVTSLRMLCHQLAMGRQLTTETNWPATIDAMHVGLKFLLPPEMERGAFGALKPFDVAAWGVPVAGRTDECLVHHEGRSLNVQIATTASVKGETHFATLVLEAHAHPARCHDMAGALSSIALGTPISAKAPASTRSYYRNLYVAASRPSHLLCVAMNYERASDLHLQALRNCGWRIRTV